MTSYLFDPPAIHAIPVSGASAQYPVSRIFCVGRNYAAHAAEMGNEVDREAPFYFTKSPQALLATGAILPYPPGTQDLHHEMELALAIGQPVFRATRDAARAAIFGYGCALDMTRRDLQGAAKDKRRPWDLGKDFEGSAVLAPLTPAEAMGEIGPQRIHLAVNGEIRQDATLDEMIHGVAEIVADLSRYYHLAPGDLILTGTPAGVGAVGPGDVLRGGIDGLAPISLTIGPADQPA
ncbi:MAG: fumarylacetoacetase [Rhodobacteraceae bacterium CG17_big_fil_post_rev_8_21_14_2_50_65_11]|nr:MAG: fumarylacetoacetase [Rhodobacteraceae bacterium CG17_big_fil_post_rev_8_21_14_2_50_65_11]